MPAPASVDEQLHALLSHEPPAVAELVHRRRAVVRDAHPDLRERVNTGWHGLAFHHPRGGYVVALFPRDGGVNVGFEHGGDLPDPHRRLTGRGRTRDVRVEVGAGPDEEDVVVDYLDLAVDAAIDRADAKAR
ncbi:DUF1801 domain-containing protein [Pseudonocardia kunmingensis]|uniref:YdhG-like domain-containing protein n=1 Tax=Pseudonocardia kunmingensis TaxID=630975 RepID=A0A543D3Y8_9PSEU|nr:DUF1801 domain-containing protein [Pseudonocardia kunmingensis]TQM04053.1 hypothetical protein FB558_7082 [Pseudonocardia kunmingensis]